MGSVTESDALQKISIPEHARRLSEPFTMIDLAQIDDLAMSIYLCQGTMPHHRHLDQDELFLVHSGTISLQSDWGNVILRRGELSVAPKGVGHRSSSLLRSTVLLLQPRLMVNRRNGDRRLFVLKDERRLEKVSVPALGHQIVAPFRPVTVADVDTFALTVMRCVGVGDWRQAVRQHSLVFCYDGRLTVDTGEEQVSLTESELVVLPSGTRHRLSSGEGALVLGLRRHQLPSLR
jgi:mannose-6-phosphate isomerase-like protein (cupin superfamily)